MCFLIFIKQKLPSLVNSIALFPRFFPHLHKDGVQHAHHPCFFSVPCLPTSLQPLAPYAMVKENDRREKKPDVNYSPLAHREQFFGKSALCRLQRQAGHADFQRECAG